MPFCKSTSVSAQLCEVCAEHLLHKGRPATVVRMTLANYIKLGSELGMLPKYHAGVRIEWYQSDQEKAEARRAG
jgi:hypothetical protein